MIDFMIRAETRARLRAFLVNRGLIFQDAGGNWIVNPNVDIDEIGNAVITPAVVDNSTFPPVVVTPAVLDTWWLAHLRLSGSREVADADTLQAGETAGSAGSWRVPRSKFVRFVREQATQITSPWGGRAYQFGTTPNRIQLLDPRDAGHSPKRVWLGGMSL
jgi:hypothetical protein